MKKPSLSFRLLTVAIVLTAALSLSRCGSSSSDSYAGKFSGMKF